MRRAAFRFSSTTSRSSRSEFFPAMMEKLAREIPTLKGLKHSAPDFSQIRVFADMGLICSPVMGLFRCRRSAWERWHDRCAASIAPCTTPSSFRLGGRQHEAGPVSAGRRAQICRLV